MCIAWMRGALGQTDHILHSYAPLRRPCKLKKRGMLTTENDAQVADQTVSPLIDKLRDEANMLIWELLEDLMRPVLYVLIVAQVCSTLITICLMECGGGAVAFAKSWQQRQTEARAIKMSDQNIQVLEHEILKKTNQASSGTTRAIQEIQAQKTCSWTPLINGNESFVAELCHLSAQELSSVPTAEPVFSPQPHLRATMPGTVAACAAQAADKIEGQSNICLGHINLHAREGIGRCCARQEAFGAADPPSPDHENPCQSPRPMPAYLEDGASEGQVGPSSRDENTAYASKRLPCATSCGFAPLSPSNISSTWTSTPDDGRFSLKVAFPALSVAASRGFVCRNTLGGRVVGSLSPPEASGFGEGNSGAGLPDYTEKLSMEASGGTSQDKGNALTRHRSQAASAMGVVSSLSSSLDWSKSSLGAGVRATLSSASHVVSTLHRRSKSLQVLSCGRSLAHCCIPLLYP